MKKLNLLKKIQNQDIVAGSPLFKEIHLVKEANEQLLVEMNTSYHTNMEMLSYLEKITGRSLAPSTTVSQPFYSDFGGHIELGEDVFINKNVTFVDLGGITIEDHVLIGPDSRLITVNHLIEPEKRRGIRAAPILIKENAWLGGNVTILPGITVGKNAVVAADSTVTKDVPDNTVVAGSPARVMKKLPS
ncbi:DapH/DapD/GlmU-related protein [Enterococcus sp. LJL128]|uniref:DapH/DapD/GlmU-related protein n=1 Tax=Enterococcus sp. LJL51 TaxID=3416656 RepID=UPI003CEA2467